MTKEIIIIALIVALIYLYYQNRKLGKLPATSSPDNPSQTIFEVGEDHEELIAEKDSAIRAKNEAEQEVLSLNNRLKNKQQEVSRKEQEIERLKKDKVRTAISSNTEIQKLKKDLTSEKQQHKGSLERIVKLTEQKVSLEAEIESLKKQVKKMPGEFPTEREDK
jgi:chromosome segregation ATPase